VRLGISFYSSPAHLRFGYCGVETIGNLLFCDAVSSFSHLKLTCQPSVNSMDGCYKVSAAFGMITVPIAIEGDGAMQTQIKVTTAMTGDLFKFSENWTMAGFPFSGNTFTVPQKTGLRISGFSVIGDRSTTNNQNAFVFYDRNDWWKIEDVAVYYMKGKALSIGKTFNTTQGYSREFVVEDFHVFNCGNGTASPCIEIGSNGTGDSTNLGRFRNLQVTYPYARAVEITNNNPNKRTTSLYFDGLMIHGLETPPTPQNYDLLYIGNRTSNIMVDQFDMNSSYVNNWAIRIAGNNSTDAPYLISLDGTMPSGAGGGLYVERGRNIYYGIMDCATTTACLKMSQYAGYVTASKNAKLVTKDIHPAVTSNLTVY